MCLTKEFVWWINARSGRSSVFIVVVCERNENSNRCVTLHCDIPRFGNGQRTENKLEMFVHIKSSAQGFLLRKKI